MRRRIAVVAAAVAVAGAGFGAYEYRHLSQIDAACQSVKDELSQTGTLDKVSSGAEKVVVLGDSYAAGNGLADRSQGWATLLGRAEGWDETVAAVGGTGFVNPGPCGGQTFAQRFSDPASLNPDLMVIEGGLNDAGSDPRDVQNAANSLLDRAYRIKNVILVGPTNAPAMSNLPAIDHALAVAAKSHGRKYISAIGWNLEFLPDRTHLTSEGHAIYANDLEAALR